MVKDTDLKRVSFLLSARRRVSCAFNGLGSCRVGLVGEIVRGGGLS